MYSFVYDVYLWTWNKKFHRVLLFKVNWVIILFITRLMRENLEQELWVKLSVDVYHDFIQIVYSLIVYIVDGIIDIITLPPPP